MRLIDHAAARVGADACRAAGYDGAIRYLANSPDRGLPNKILLPEEAARYIELGMPLVSNWQASKADYKRGYAGGVEDAKAAAAQHVLCGGPPDRPIYFSVDADVSLATWNALVLPYLNGAASVTGKNRVGVYGGQRSMWWAEEDGFTWRWQTAGWSRYDENGNWNSALPVQWVDGVQIRQERVDQDRINGIGIDVNTTWADDYGQWNVSPVPQSEKPIMESGPWTGDPVWLADVLRAEGLNVIEHDGWRERGHGDFLDIRGVLCHHTAGGGSNDWQIVQNGRSDLPGPLAQLVLERDGTFRVIAVGVCWHAGRGSWPGWPTNNANYHTIGIEAVNNGTGQEWPAVQLDAYHRGCAAILRRLGRTASDCVGHKEYSSEGKIDPYPLDMNDFRRQVQAAIDDGGEMALQETFKNYRGQETTLGTAVFYLDKYVNEIREQLGGPEPYKGWAQLGNKTLVDSLADAHNKLDTLGKAVADLAAALNGKNAA